MKQDKLIALEERLERLDLEESCGAFLGSFRCDRNVEREDVLTQIDLALAEYGLLNLCVRTKMSKMRCLFMSRQLGYEERPYAHV